MPISGLYTSYMLKEIKMTRTLTLRSLDIPSVHKFGIGFDSTINELLRLTEQNNSNYPPYNIVKQTEDKFYIEVAAAGFGEGDIRIEVENHTLTITGSKQDSFAYEADKPEPEYLHRGISNRNFERSFRLGEHVEVIDAQNYNGILTIYLERQVPEEMKPKSIDIKYIK